MYTVNNPEGLKNEALQNIRGISNIVSSTPIERPESIEPYLTLYYLSVLIILREIDELSEHDVSMFVNSNRAMADHMIAYYKTFPEKLNCSQNGAADITRFYESSDSREESQ